MKNIEDDKLLEIVLKYKNIKFSEYPDVNNEKVSFEQFIENETKKIEQKLDGKQVIYLDTNFWVNFRKVVQNEKVEEPYKYLYLQMKKKVDENKIICPISTTNFTELLRQIDPKTKNATAKIMAEFSLGIGLKFYFDRIEDEFFNFINKYLNANKKNKLRFDFVNNILGTVKIICDSGEKTELSLQKILYLYTQTMSFEDYASMGIPEQEDLLTERNELKQVTHDMNLFKDQNKDKTFDEVFNITLTANIATFKCYIENALKKISNQSKNISDDTLNEFVNIIVWSFKNGKLSKDDMPLLYIQSLLDAIYVKDGDRKFKDNDYDDLRHAAEALSSSDLFLTERSLANVLINMKPKLAENYNLTVIDNPQKALEYIINI